MSNTHYTRLLTAVPQLPAIDIPETVSFFVNNLKFAVTAEYPGFVIMKRDDVELHFWQCNDRLIAENSSCYLRVQLIEELWDVMQKLELKILEPLEVKPWGMKQFTIIDPNGNAIRFGEPA